MTIPEVLGVILFPLVIAVVIVGCILIIEKLERENN